MKKLSKILAAAVIAAVPLLAGAPAGAQECVIENTGPDSNNTCLVKDDFECEVVNENQIKITNKIDQTAITGDATVEGNTNGGAAITGDAGNVSDVTFNVTIENGGCVIDSIVVPEEEEPETPPTPVTPTQPEQPVRPVGGRGEVLGAGAGAAVLPATSSDATLSTLGAIAVSLGAIAGLGVAGTLVYRRLKSI